MYPYESVPESSGFRFQETDAVEAVMDGDDPDRHFSIEVDSDGLWFVPCLGEPSSIPPAGPPRR